MIALTNAELVAAMTGSRRSVVPSVDHGVRFAFYGRMSTSEFQDPRTSRAWQRAISDELIDGIGMVAVEFFDVGRSRRWSWSDRPQAAALLAEAASPGRRFDAVVVGEYERAFHGDQFREIVTQLNALGIEVWLPEAGGPVELDSPVHQALMVLLGAQAQREVARARQRVLAAMRVQASQQGRFLGGRPPYGYRLVDAGCHPNSRHSQWGRQLQKLGPDSQTAPWVRWIFEQRSAGRAVASIVRELNDRNVPCPASADPTRNKHRSGARWVAATVTSILENPRYTGRQVWNRQATSGYGTGGRTGGRGSGRARRKPATEWEISGQLAHIPLIDDMTFVAVQSIRAQRMPKCGTTREYALAGLVVCEACGRRMDSHWVHGRPGYRCRHGYNSASGRPLDAPRVTYVREDVLLEALRSLVQPAGGEEPVNWLRREGQVMVHGPGVPTVSKADGSRAVVPAAVVTTLTLPLEWEAEPVVHQPRK
ncbi:recombinase family protein [Lentzea aerocolonigenes]|uniref:recombinase family protein n=1 Tax=Lentzea aerocolonigenes TaxID=68170 RepID=UPI0006977475|nr:recombinase family protein [Lentzea aerocolonigenes]